MNMKYLSICVSISLINILQFLVLRYVVLLKVISEHFSLFGTTLRGITFLFYFQNLLLGYKT